MSFSRTKALIKKIARPIVRLCITFVTTHPALKNRIVTLANRLGFYQLLRSVYWRLSGRGHFLRIASTRLYMSEQPGELTQLTPRAREIYADLKVAIKNEQGFR